MSDPFRAASKFQTALRNITRAEDANIANVIARANDRRRQAWAELDDATKRVVRSSWEAEPAWMAAETTAGPAAGEPERRHSEETVALKPSEEPQPAAEPEPSLPAWATADVPESPPVIAVEREERKVRRG